MTDRPTPQPSTPSPTCGNCGANDWSYEGRDEPICKECGHAMPTPVMQTDPRWCNDMDCFLLEKGVWGHPVSAHDSWRADSPSPEGAEPQEGWIDPATGDGYAPDQPKTKHAEHDRCYWAGYEQGRIEREAALPDRSSEGPAALRAEPPLDVERLIDDLNATTHGSPYLADEIRASAARLRGTGDV